MAQKIHPLKARSRFKARLLVGMVFTPVRMFCEHCDNYLPSNLEWRCGYCAFDNYATKFYSFLNKCQHCKRPPKSYICWHCAKLNFFDKDKDGSHPARPLSLVEKEERAKALAEMESYLRPTKEQAEAAERAKKLAEERAKKSEEHTDRRVEKSREIEIAELDARLAKWKAAAESHTKDAFLDGLRKEGEQRVVHNMGVHVVAEELIQKYKELCKDSPDLMEKNEDTIRDWVEDQALSQDEKSH